MESNSNDGGKPRETVILIFKKERFEVEKQKLIDKSQYFNALLSMNYMEYGQREHIINYDISSILLKDFIDWIHHGKIVFTSATSSDFEELDHLLILLELSVLFATDKLIEDITDRLERHFMLPKYAIKIWLLAQELNINVLRDLSLAVCLDRFYEVPPDSIYELSKEHFISLIGNINLRAAESYLLGITRQWMNHRHDFTVSLDIIKNKKAKILQSVISCEYNNGEQYIHCWDGNDFFELTSFEYPADIVEHCCITGKSLEGMQITARRYDLYLCGGEYGIGKFNRNIWRYSLISKRWILETVMPVWRRDMIAVFLKDKLYLVAGVGRDRQELQTIDIYDIYTGVWTTSRTKISFTSVPQHFIFNDKLIIQRNNSVYYIYCPDEDVCETKSFSVCIPRTHMTAYIPSSIPSSLRILKDTTADIPILTLKHMSCYIDVVDQDEMALKVVTETCNVEGCNNIIKTFYKSNHEREKGSDIYKGNSDLCYLLRVKYDQCVLTPFFHSPHSSNYHDSPAILLCQGNVERHDLRKLHLHSIPIQEPRKFRSLLLTKKNITKKLFNIHHPAYLHATNLDHI